jgi:hypothetical protein
VGSIPLWLDPTFAKYGYPQLALSCVTDQAPALIKKYPGLFVFQQSTTTFCQGCDSRNSSRKQSQTIFISSFRRDRWLSD